MGILDDAIREHLDLKRRAGADPQEIEKLEREALGPVRRGPRDGQDDAMAGEPAPDTALDEAPPGSWPQHADGLPEPWPDELPGPSSLPRDAGSVADFGAEPTDSDALEDWEHPEPGGIGVEPDLPAPATPPAATQPPLPPDSIDESQYLEQETVEHEIERETEPSGEDDVLEETPEFLQETPDHDRLWFEQRPPRDFDLDG
jgi:hypothetical protein